MKPIRTILVTLLIASNIYIGLRIVNFFHTLDAIESGVAEAEGRAHQ